MTDNKKNNFNTPQDILLNYIAHIENKKKEITDIMHKHDIKIFNEQFSNYFAQNVSTWNYDFYEYGNSLIDKKKGNVALQKSFSNVIYIDMPTIFDITEQDYNANYSSITLDLREMLNKENAISIDKDL